MNTNDKVLEIAQWEASHLGLIMQCAYLEALYGKGPRAAIDWIIEYVETSDSLPELASDYKNHTAQDWYDLKVVQAPTP